MAIEDRFDVGFVARLTADEKQIQQNYRPVIGVHKWFARRPGALFRSLLLAEFAGERPLADSYYASHALEGLTIADPFMGGGTTLFEANRLGANVIGFDINPLAWWIVRQELLPLDRALFRTAAEEVLRDLEAEIGDLYVTRCTKCQRSAPVKYFLWVKQQRCRECRKDFDLFPGYLIAENSRHPNYVLHCPGCQHLIEVARIEKGKLAKCPECSLSFDWQRGTAIRNRYTCPHCQAEGKYPEELRTEGPPRHRFFGMEYHCERCKVGYSGRFFKDSDEKDLARVRKAEALLARRNDLVFPTETIPDGDETRRLHRWGYTYYREMFNERQRLTLGLLLKRIQAVEEREARHALATIFSDSLRYQNMLCRYDSYALKCQDIFSVHGFPVGLIECENNVLGIPRVGSGSFRHFVEKYDRAKAYCEAPFETVKRGTRKRLVPIRGERIAATNARNLDRLKPERSAFLRAGSIEEVDIPKKSLDAVFTDPPYFDNVQYAELADFCYVWLRILLGREFPEFRTASTRSVRELTGNATAGKDLAHFTEGLSAVFVRTARGLKPGAPFVFTYHHNDVEAYVPIVVALLDAGLSCTAALPCPAEMSASLHINGTGSSVIDTVLVCRQSEAGVPPVRITRERLKNHLLADRKALATGGVSCTAGDLSCLALGHLSRATLSALSPGWKAGEEVAKKMERVEAELRATIARCSLDDVVRDVLGVPDELEELPLFREPLETGVLDEVGHRRD